MAIQGSNQEQLQRIIEIQSTLAQADLDINQFMLLVVNTLQELTHAKDVHVELKDRQSLLIGRVNNTLSNQIVERVCASLSKLCVSKGDVVLCADCESDDRVDRESCRQAGICSLMCTPLYQTGVPVGVLTLTSDKITGFNEDDVQALKLLAAALGAAFSRQIAFDALRLTEARLRMSEMRMRVILEHANEAVISTDQFGTVIRWNRAAGELFGCSHQDAVGQNIVDLIVPVEQRETLKKFIGSYHHDAVWRAPIARQEFAAVDHSGNSLVVEISLTRHRFENVWEYTAFVHDISERKRIEQNMRDISETDELTGLANRTKILEEINAAITAGLRRNDGLALFYLDLNGFKKINDTLGHEAGDLVLHAFAERLLSSIRSKDIAGRLGGDEFIVLAKGVHNEVQARFIARKIIGALRAPLPTLGVQLEASIGISLYRSPLDSAQWLNEADKAMYVAKRLSGGGSRIVFSADAENEAVAADIASPDTY